MRIFGRPQTLRARLTLTYTVAFALGLCVFAVVTLALIDQILKATLDARMASAARAVIATFQFGHGDPYSDRLNRGRLVKILGVQQNGAVILPSGEVAVATAAVPPAVAAAARGATSGASSFATVKVEGSSLRILARLLSDPPAPALVVWRTADFLEDYERLAAIVFAAAIVALAALAALIGGQISRRSLAPLREMVALASEIEAHDLSGRLGGTPFRDELGRLSETFNRMLSRLESAFERQRRFTADASHDLRAPLSVIRAEVDLALKEEDLPPAGRAAFLSIRTEVNELESLLEDLLLIARADTGALTHEPIDLGAMLKSVAGRIQTFAATRDVRLETLLDGNGCCVLGDRALLERAFLSLLHNAVKFAQPGGRVSVSGECNGEWATCVICDDGPGFSDQGLARAFDRFWREDAARGSSGSGLGLAIAKTTIDRLGGEVSLRNLDDGGAAVTVRLPLETPAQT